MNDIVVAKNISQHFLGFTNNSNRFRNCIYNLLDIVCQINVFIDNNINNNTFTLLIKIVKCLTCLILAL